MKFLRSKFLTAVLFTLVSIGQGYSFGYLYDLSQSSDSFGSSSASSNQVQENPTGLILCHDQWRVALSEKPLPTKTRSEILNFRVEPFIPRLIGLKGPIFISEFISEKSIFFTPFRFSPETPPPKFS